MTTADHKLTLVAAALAALVFFSQGACFAPASMLSKAVRTSDSADGEMRAPDHHLSGHGPRVLECPLSGAKQTSL